MKTNMRGSARYTMTDIFDQEAPKADEAFPGDPRVYLCEVCGKVGCFGFGVNLRAGIVGRWACGEHREQVMVQK